MYEIIIFFYFGLVGFFSEIFSVSVICSTSITTIYRLYRPSSKISDQLHVLLVLSCC